jgi:Na+-transporting NADH:ubiquinone oxidoreductase subunit NqrB
MRWIDDVRHSLARLDGSPAALRRFALVIGAALLALGGWRCWRGGEAVGGGLIAAAAALLLAGLVAPARLARVHRAWMALALALGWVTSRLVLTLLFLLAVTPVAVAARLLGKRFLERHPDRGADSYWAARPPGRRVDYLKLH